MRAAYFPVMLLGLASTAFGTLIFNDPVVDPSNFRLTQFTNSPIGTAYSLQRLPDGSVAVLEGGTIQRLTDLNSDGIADDVGTPIYHSNGAFLTGFVKVGDLYAVGDYNSSSITLLKPGATPADPMTAVGSINFNYAVDWYHPTAGLSARPTPGSPGSYDLVFNVGSQYNDQLSTDQVPLTGLVNASVDGDSIYKITINETGPTPTLSGLQKVATGIRNVAGMQFATNGDFYFADNAIDGPGADGDEPPQADELNRILLADFGATLPDFGYPTCYIGYRSGSQVGTNCVDPYLAFQPIDNGTLLGLESEGPVEMAFAPSNFPAGFNNGIFIGFAGKSSTGPSNEENAVVYYDFGTGKYIHFTESGLPGVGRPVGLLSTSDALYISDLNTGIVYEITAAVPEPSSLVLTFGALTLLFASRKKLRP
ncbi:MAG: PEP-CTERM sorting domain-containing protein [Acidobacteriota bacterium]